MRSRQFRVGYGLLFFFYLLANFITVLAQPSGGPYGPVRQSYELPKGAHTIFFVAQDGKPEATGESLAKPTTLEAAFEKVKTGDVIVLRGGTYRTGNLLLNQGITIQPYADEQPIVKGTYVASQWKNLNNGLWKTSWSKFFPSTPDPWWNRDKFGKDTPLHIFNNDMVFIDGMFLKAVGSEEDVKENSYYIDYAKGEVYIGTDPAHRLVEITAFDVALQRVTGVCHGKKSDQKGSVIRGITFTQYAYRAIEVEGKEPEAVMAESDYGKEVVGTTLENCTITFCSRVAAYLRGDHLTVRQCIVSETSTEGLYIIGSSDVLLEKNIFSRNNIELITGYYPAAVKIFNQSRRVTCRDNFITDLPYSNGIWYDVGEVDGVFINNRVEGVGKVNRKLDNKRPWPSESGFFFEISKGAICAGNVFVNCDQGIFILNSANVQVYNNTFINSVACFGRNARTPANDGLFGWHSSTGPDVIEREGHVFMNNLLTGDENFHRPLMFVWQPDSMCSRLPKSMLKQFDYNSFVRNSNQTSEPLIWWSPVVNKECQGKFESLDSLKKLYPEFLSHSQFKTDKNIPVLKSPMINQYQTVQVNPGSTTAAEIPAEISKLLGLQKDVKYIGAYPPAP